MTANVETLAYVREVPWHGLGTKIEELMTAEEALIAGGVNWTVEKEALYLNDGTEVAGSFANVRQSDRSVLGIVGAPYQIVQNDEAFAWADNLVDSGAAKYETVGSLMGGRRVFVSMELPEGIRVAGDDGEIKPYLLVTNGHDGSTSLQASVTMVRVVCMNTWTLALQEAKRSFKIRHTGSIDGKLAAAREALGITFTYTQAFQAVADKLVAKTLTEKQIESILRAAFPVPESQDKPDRIDSSDFAKVLNVYRTSDNLDPIRGTGWGVLQATGEYLDHEVTYFGRRFDAASVRADSILYDGPAAHRKQAVLNLLLGKVKVAA